MPEPKRKAQKTVTVRRTGVTTAAGLTAFSQTREVAAGSYRVVFIHGIPYGIAHRVAVRDLKPDAETLCKNRPGKSVAPGADQRRCPVCFKGDEQ